jgi:hypothetical protein
MDPVTTTDRRHHPPGLLNPIQRGTDGQRLWTAVEAASTAGTGSLTPATSYKAIRTAEPRQLH